MTDIDLFQRGDSRRIMNVMRGRIEDMEVYLFDYQYTHGRGRHSQSFEQTVVLFRSPRVQVPAFDVRPERWLHKIGMMLGYQDIDFPDAPRFSRKYLLQGRDEKAVRELFAGKVRRYFQERSKLAAAGYGALLAFYHPSKRIRPLHAQKLIDQGLQFLRLLETGQK